VELRQQFLYTEAQSFLSTKTMEKTNLSSRRGMGASPKEFETKEVKKMKKLLAYLKNEEGVTAIEYGLIAALIAVVIIAAVTLVGTNLVTMFTTVAGELI